MSKTHIVLVHGSYHRAWHLQLLKRELDSAGYIVSSPELPSCGADQPIANAMSADAKVIKTAIEQAAAISDAVIPVFHSYAGVCGSEAAAQLDQTTRQKIRRIIYLAAFVITEGKSIVTPGKREAPWGATSQDRLWKSVPEPIAPLYHDVEPELAKEAASRCVRQCKSAQLEATKYAGWRMYPTTYIFCDDDRAIPPAVQKGFFDALSENDRRGWEFETSAGSHSPFLARPKDCADLIRKITEEI